MITWSELYGQQRFSVKKKKLTNPISCLNPSKPLAYPELRLGGAHIFRITKGPTILVFFLESVHTDVWQQSLNIYKC